MWERVSRRASKNVSGTTGINAKLFMSSCQRVITSKKNGDCGGRTVDSIKPPVA